MAVPAPTSITLSTNIPNHTIVPPFGSNVILACAVELTSGPAMIDVALNVTFELFRKDPPGPALTTTPPSVSGSTHTTTAVIDSFGRSDSGDYTCRVNISVTSTNAFIDDSTSTVSSTLRVTIGKIFSMNNNYQFLM